MNIATIFDKCMEALSNAGYNDNTISNYKGVIRRFNAFCLKKGVTEYSPNMIETKFLSNIDKRVIEITANEASMHRNINIEEVVSGLHFLLSDSSNYMTGINLNMSGGDRM